ncbi:hypothetical protein NQ036_12375 [Brevibacterium sp. 91QC2O2]|uniref:hypothetical protein n=1 Tax=Brevibacterium sp. 91QC2O2 TaxID=2968458 RepID=UPI00211C2453|nr:hypothetical protein [Brevibacterium sp. 91QC2O2]MCQ9369034.1 hypothetical protein [Brevibacterium sp. 91QC2O2]
MFKKASQKNSCKLLSSNVSDVVTGVTEAVREGSAQAIEKSGPYLEKANAFLHETAERLHAAADDARPKVTAALESGKQRATEAVSDARDQIDARYGDQIADASVELTRKRGKLLAQSGDQLTRLSALVAGAKTPAAVTDLATRLTGDKKALKKAQSALAERGKELAKAAKKQAKIDAKAGKKGGRWFIWVLFLGAAGGIGYFVYKALKPVEDPWSTPLPGNRPADARPVGSTPASEAAKPVVSKVEEPTADDAGEVEAEVEED